MFLSDTDLEKLTGRKQKSRQVAELRRLGVPFYVNASGHPVVARAVLEGGKPAAPVKPSWEPTWAASHR